VCNIVLRLEKKVIIKDKIPILMEINILAEEIEYKQ
jgi:hypothetical protein